ncbi:MAG TPA: bifunctional (p)ppGpp synthetase/guanosine-3',5'-bis(diphosphate) 3'-pyrophosphohydrolase [Ktedonobacteraceae bacterium]|nr:bifunctional (p)ppGpp synthetase/guanosine-3',5'-bis(diphosphate) 3'-pyrophosphohydrolase [Ktedonobacteraceae bacterium]
MTTINDGQPISSQLADERVDERASTAAGLPQVSITPVVQQALKHLLEETRQYLAPQEMEKIERAFALANWAHRGVVRRSGEPYILHPLEVALLLADMRIDAEGIAAALMHDVVEDTDYTLDDVREQFGPTIANIVDGVTKFDALVGPNGERLARTPSAQAHTSAEIKAGQDAPPVRTPEMKRRQRTETVRKMMLAMAEDPRVVVLKLADRLHNMRTLNVMNAVQQQNTARETNEIFSPLARRLGMALVQAELEDLAFSYLEPEKYTRLAREVAEELRKRQPYIDEVCRILEEEMERAGIAAEVHFRQKHLASINRKLQQNGGELSQVYDLVSFRILVDSDQDCYLALGHIHALWRPKDGRIKDFIATPKLNGYQSLHTTVFCLDNRLAEIQIRTHEMQRTADYGVASYWYLKERGDSRLSYREMVAWIEQLRDWQRELPQSADEFVEAVKGDIFQEQIFVFTPKGEVKDLPRGSTPLDMAYRIHTDIGDHCAGARIITNMADTGRLVTRLVPLDYELKGGEIVDIVTNRSAHPTRDWLSFARTAAARNKIRRYLKTYEREINLQLGQERLDISLKAAGAPGLQALNGEDFASFTSMKKYPLVDDVYVALGREDLPVDTVVEKLLPILQSRETEKAQQNGGNDTLTAPVEGTLYHKHGVVKLAHCCCPLPGDAIVGYLNPNRGMFVHRSDCRTIRRYREQGRSLVEVNWLQIEPQPYLAPIMIVARDRAGLLRDVAAIVSDAGINMTAVSSSTNASLQKAIITATLEIKTVDQIEYIFKRLRQIKNVIDVKRDV